MNTFHVNGILNKFDINEYQEFIKYMYDIIHLNIKRNVDAKYETLFLCLFGGYKPIQHLLCHIPQVINY